MARLDVTGIRAALRETPEPLFFSIHRRRLRRAALRQADVLLLRRGWAHPGPEGGVVLEAPFPWADGLDTPFAPSDHSFDLLDPLLEAHSWSHRPEYLLPAAGIAADWARRGASGSTAAGPAVLGDRAYRLGYLIRAAAAEDQISDDDLKVLLKAAITDAKALARDSAAGGVLIRACGLLSLTAHLGEAVPAIGSLRAEATAGAVGAFRSRFSAEGLHLGQSPARHVEVLRMLASVLDAGLADGTRLLVECREQAEEVLAWLTLPDGSLAGFGDTEDQLVSPHWGSRRTAAHLVQEQFKRASMIHAATAGTMGDAPESPVRAFATGGIAVVKQGWPRSPTDREDSTYLAMQAGFHSEFHKHADDLSFIWFDRGRQLLVDGGFTPGERASGEDGFEDDEDWQPPGAEVAPDVDGPEDDEEAGGALQIDLALGQAFVRSAGAHNTIEIDGHDHDLTREPYGSALHKWGEVDGVAVLEARVTHGAVEHRRSLALLPGSWLLVLDDIADEDGQSHRIRQFFQAAEGLQVMERAGGFLLSEEGSPLVWATSLLPGPALVHAVRGRADEPVRGWRAAGGSVLIPIWSFGWEADGRAVSFATLFTLDGPASIIEGDETGLAWQCAGSRVGVAVGAHGIEDVQRHD